MPFHNAPFICPICSSALTQLEQRLICPNAHSFDLAREGYVNLLRQSKKARIWGDAKAMLHARRAFLQHGHYAPIAAAVSQVAHHWIAELETAAPAWLVDMGCGEGYYLHQVMQHFSHECPGAVRCCGFDLAKDAVRMAAKLNKTGAFAVADVNQPIPLANHSMHVLLNIFAPRNGAEFARILAPGGQLLVVIPTAEHLHEWRAALAQQGFTPLGIDPEKEERIQAQFAADFKPEHAQNVCYTIELEQEDLANLLQMTPNAWHLSAVELEKTGQLARLRTTVSIQLLTFRRR